MKQKNSSLATNRKARYDYSVTETFEAGLVLLGTEIKSIREGKITSIFNVEIDPKDLYDEE